MLGGHHRQHSMGMSWSAASTGGARSQLSRAISAQLARALEVLEAGKDVASAVHEARRAIKRARALLRLADPSPRDSHTGWTLRDAGRALAVIRDADVLVLTAKGIRDGSPPSEPDVVPLRLIDFLEEERGRRFADSGSPDGPIRAAGKLLRAVVMEIQEPRAPELVAVPETAAAGGIEATAPGATELLRLGLGASYTAVRARSDPATGEGPVDERSHKLRKRVKDLRYQLEFLDTGHPKLGRLVRDLHHLTDLLGDRNDLATLSAHTASADLLCESERTALLTHIEGAKQTLLSEATALSARLFKEEAASFVPRIEAWVTEPQGPPQGPSQG